MAGGTGDDTYTVDDARRCNRIGRMGALNELMLCQRTAYRQCRKPDAAGTAADGRIWQ